MTRFNERYVKRSLIQEILRELLAPKELSAEQKRANWGAYSRRWWYRDVR